MLAKLIVWGASREEALARMEQALMQFHVLGVRTNIAYLLAIIRHPEFRAGRTHTGFLAQHLAGWKPNSAVPEEVLLALAAESVTRPGRGGRATAGAAGDVYNPWRSNEGWRAGSRG
jgi:3-methylcrotonyl-CoA carboxylase alpha subunit